MGQYRITWRHEVYIDADNEKDAKDKWVCIDLGQLNKAVGHDEISSHNFVESVSFEDENYDEVN